MDSLSSSLAVPAASASGRCLTANLTRRYGLILVGVTVLLVADQAMLQPRLWRLSLYAPRINIAGRQRMLSQKLVKAGLALQAADEGAAREQRRSELLETLELWQSSHVALQRGSDALEIPPTTSPEVLAEFADLQPHFQAMVDAASALAAGKRFATYGPRLLEHESQYLPTMDRIVGMVEAEARSQARALRVLGLVAAASIVSMMLALGRFVLRPATQAIGRQMGSLEERVTERTAELTEANQNLEREVQERRQAEQRTRELSGQLARTSRVQSLGQLAVGLAHEINQPLTAIANYAETCALELESGPSNHASCRRLVQRISGAALRAGNIVRSMRDFLRPGQTPTERVDVNQLIDDALCFCHLELMRGDVQVERRGGGEAVVARVAATQIQQVLMNLLQNAVQALEAIPADNRRVTIGVARSGEHIQVEVADNGPGFGCQDPEALFEPFYTTKETGLGMGLAIARGIIREHAGRLWAENRPRGAAVCFTLPFEPEQDHVVDAASDCVCRR